VEKPESGDYNGTLKRVRTVTLWMFAAAFSMMLNIALFDLMPCLIDRNPGRPEYSDFVETVNIIRIKRPEPQVRRKDDIRNFEGFAHENGSFGFAGSEGIIRDW